MRCIQVFATPYRKIATLPESNNPCLRNGRQGIICSDLYLSISIHVQTATDMALRVHYTSY